MLSYMTMINNFDLLTYDSVVALWYNILSKFAELGLICL